jgi:2-octaprenylphenol hydroxylase
MLKLDDGTEIKAELLVGADGVNSGIRELNGMAVSRHDYHQTAVACIVKTALDHENIARQRFLSSGPLAFLPMANPRSCGIVWSTGSEYAGELLELEDKEFARRLQSAFESRLGEITDCRPRARFSLFRVNAVNYIKERCVLVGDAAHSIHPMAGLGANMGLLDVAALAELIMEAKRDNRDIGSRKILRKYERWRKYENSRLMAVLEVIKLLFEQDNTAMNNLRSTGMNTINSTPFIKNPIMRHAMGLAGDMPALVRRTLIQGLN